MTSRWSRLLPFLRPYLGSLLLAVLFLLGTAASTLLTIPIAAAAGRSFGHLTLAGLDGLALAVILAFFLKSTCSWAQNLLLAHASLSAMADLRETLFRRIQAQSIAFFKERHVGDLASRLVTDVNLVREAAVWGFVDLLPNLVILVGSLTYLVVLNWRLALLTLVGVPLLAWAIGQFSARIRTWSLTTQDRVADLLAHAAERLGNVQTVKAFAQESAEETRFSGINRAHQHALFRSAQAQTLQTPVVSWLQTVGLTGVIWYGGWEILQGRLSTPELLAFGAAIGISVDPVVAISAALARISQAVGALVRVVEVLDLPDTPSSPDVGAPFARAHGELAFDDVHFAYDAHTPILRGVSFRLEPGQVLAVVGPSGAGKSTLAALLLRFYDPDAGAIRLDGHDLRELPLAFLRRQIGYVPQDTPLFSGTIAENIAYGRPDAPMEAIVEAARNANAEEFILPLPEGYRTQVGERGCTLSGGQRQRIAIARALLVDPRLLILDEATSALDPASEQLVQEALGRLMEGRTTVMITHRLAGAARADRVARLTDGELVGWGTPEEVLTF